MSLPQWSTLKLAGAKPAKKGDMSLNRCLASMHLYAASHHPIRTRMLVLPFVCFVFAATTPAFGDVYKWADEGGVVHYSSVPPEKPKAKVKRIDSKELAVSQAKNSEHDAIQRPEMQAAQDLTDKVDELQRRVDTEHQARQAADAQNVAAQAAYAQALAGQQAARNAAYIPTIPTVSGVFFVPPLRRTHDHPCHSVAAGAMTNCDQPDVDHDRHGFDHTKPDPGVRH